MKKLVVTLAVGFTLSLPAQAAYVMGSKCGLIDNWGDVEEATTTFDLSKPVDKMKGLIKSLIKVVKSQIISSANGGKMSVRKINNTTDAIKALQEGSEGEEVYLKAAIIKGKKYSVLAYYGGGNPTGYIYPWGKGEAVAEISDDDIVCMPRE